MRQARNCENKSFYFGWIIEYRLKGKKEKLEIKRDQEFYTLEYHPKKKE